MDGDFRAPWGIIHHDTEQMAVGEACPWHLTPLASAGGPFGRQRLAGRDGRDASDLVAGRLTVT